MKSKRTEPRYEHQCDYCDGAWVRRELKARELIRVSKADFVALEKVPVGVCDRCKAQYYHASVLKQAQALLRKGTARKVLVPIATYTPQ